MKRQVVFGLIWLTVFPPLVWIAYHYFPSREVDWFNLCILFVLVFTTILVPIRIQEVTVSFEKWVTFGIFLQYGVFTELLVVQLTVFIMLFVQKTPLPLLYKFFVNSMMFAIVSVISGFIFYFFGGSTGSYDFTHVMLFMILYALTYTFVNNLFLKGYFKTRNIDFSLKSEAAVWDFISTMMMVPFGISLYFLQHELGNKSVFLIGVPLLIALLAMKVLNDSNQTNDQLSNASKLSRELANQLMFDEVMSTFLKRMKDIVEFEHAYIVDFRNQKHLVPLMEIEGDMIIRNIKSIVFKSELTQNSGIHLTESLLFYNQRELKKIEVINFLSEVQSGIITPIIRENKTEGFLIFTSYKKNNFFESDLQIIEMLAGFFAISLQKARIYERALNESEVCRLTGLNNFRHLDRKLQWKVDEFHKQKLQHLSLVILDIDHFKSINDKYGHENGNLVLKQLSNILKTFQEECITLARYGGEEFIYLLPNFSKEEAINFAEKIRQIVEETTISITSDLSADQKKTDIKITISLGVATMPTDGTTSSALMRHADRALYLGAKQAGRNKVGVSSL